MPSVEWTTAGAHGTRTVWGAAQCGVLTAVFWNSFSWLAAASGGGAFAASHVVNVGQSFLRQSEQAAREQPNTRCA